MRREEREREGERDKGRDAYTERGSQAQTHAPAAKEQIALAQQAKHQHYDLSAKEGKG